MPWAWKEKLQRADQLFRCTKILLPQIVGVLWAWQVLEALFKNCRGFVKCYFVVPLGTRFAFEAERLDFITAVENTFKCRWTNLWIATNSIYIVMAFKSRITNVLWRFRNRIALGSRICKSVNICVSRIYRELNYLAGKLALIVTHLSEGLQWFSAPSFLKNLICRDLVPFFFIDLGTVFFRIIHSVLIFSDFSYWVFSLRWF